MSTCTRVKSEKRVKNSGSEIFGVVPTILMFSLKCKFLTTVTLDKMNKDAWSFGGLARFNAIYVPQNSAGAQFSHGGCGNQCSRGHGSKVFGGPQETGRKKTSRRRQKAFPTPLKNSKTGFLGRFFSNQKTGF